MIWLNCTSRNKQRVTNVRSVFPSTKLYSLADGHLISEQWAGTYDVSSTFDRIIYALGTQHKHATLCLHLSEASSSTPQVIESLWYNASNPTVKQVCPIYHTKGLSFMSLAKAAFDTQTGFNLQDKELVVNGVELITTNWDKLRPDLTEVSVPNFMLDLGQIKSLWKLWNVRKKLLHNLASLNLNYQYGWRPTIGDVSSMINSISGLHKKLADWDNSLGQLRRKRVTVLNESKSGSGTFTVGGTESITWTGQVTRKVTAHIAYRPLRIPVLGGLQRDLLGALDSLGFELNPGIIWDAIPFSFVVDWFLDVGGLCNALKVDTLELPFALVDSYLQYHESYNVDVQSGALATSDHKYITYPGASYRRKFFHRASMAPHWESLLSFGWKLPSLNQAVLGLSLGLSRH